MRPWNNTRRVEVEIDFGAGARALGSAVGTGRQIQFAYSGSRLPPLTPPSVDFDTAAALISGAPQDEDADRVRAAVTMARSLGGARPKAYVYMHSGAFTTQDSPGAEPWIVKFPAREDGPEAGVIEYAYSIMARKAGIDMPPTALLNSNTTPGYFAIRRFDREPDGGRLHMHSLAGLLNATADSAVSYHDLLMVTGALMQPRDAHLAGFDEQIRRMAFNVFARNRDDHVKNHAFLMDRHGHWRCAPAYDLTFADGERHALMIADDRRDVGREDMLVVTRQLGLEDSHVADLIDEVHDAVRRWPEHANEAGVSPQMTKDIASALNVPAFDGPKGSGKSMAPWYRHGKGRDDRI